MAYSLRAWYEHESIFGVVDRIEIYEDGFGGTDIELEGKGKAFKFEHREITSEGSGGILSVHDNQIMMGVLDFFPLIDNATKKTLIQDISDADPFDFQVRLVRDGTTVWYGYPSGRVFSYPEKPSYFATLQFKDFEVLQTQDFPLEDNRQHIITTLADLFSYIVSQSIYTVTSFQEENTTLSDDFLNQVYHDTVGLREYGSSGDEADTPITVYDALIHASEAVLLIKQWDGFRVDQLSGYADPSAVLQSEYNASGVQQSSTTVDVRQTINASAESSRPWMKVTSDNDTYPSVHKAKVFFNHRTSESGIQVPSIVSLEESTAETGTISASTGSTVVTGSGTSFLSDVSEGDTLWVPQSGELRELGEVASVTDNTSLILTAQANYTVSGSAWHIDAEETGRYSQEFSSDGTQRIRLATTVRVTGNFGTTQIYGRYRIKSGSYWYNKTTDGWTNSGEVINEFRARGTTSEVSGSIALETSNIPDAADGTLELTLFIAEDQNDSSANVDVTTYEDTTFAIRENTAAGNSNGTEHELTQTGGFDTYDFGEDWYGDGVLGAVYLPANYRHGTGTTDVTEDSWRRRGETTYIGFHELKLREVIDFQRSRARKIYGEAWGEIDPNKVGVYQSNNYYYAGGVYDGRWRPRYMRINQQTSSSDDYVSRIRLSDSGGGGGSSSTVGSGGLTESEADGLYFRQNELLSEVDAGDLPTLYGNIGLDDGSADLDLNSLDINGSTFVDSSRNVSANFIEVLPVSDPAIGHFSNSGDSGARVIGSGTSAISFAGGATFDGSDWIAKHTNPQILSTNGGNHIWFSIDGGLTVGGTFTPTKKLEIFSTFSRFNNDLTVTDTLTINSQLLFSLGNEQLLSTDAGVDFVDLTLTDFLTVGGVSTFNGAIDANATANFQGNITTQANLADDGFSAGFQGSNWQITNAGQAEFEDVFIRGGLTAYEAIINRVRYNFGNTVLSAGGGKVASVSGSAGSETVVFEDPEGNTILPVAEGDLLLLQSWDLNRTTIIKRIWRKVASISGSDVTLTKDGDMPSDTGSIVAGDELVVNGNDGTTANRDAIIFQSVTETTHPFIKIQDNINSFTDWGSDSTTQVLIGDLTDAPDLSNGTTPSGIGFFAKGSAYLEGEIVAGSGEIAGWGIQSDRIQKDAGAGYAQIFQSGSIARFLITPDGDLSSGTGNLVSMFWNSSTGAWGITGRIAGDDVFQLGSTNQIATWNFDNTDIWTGSSSKSSATVRLGSTEGLIFDVGGGASASDQRTLKWLDSGSLRGGMFVSAGGRTQIVGYDGSNPVVGVQIDDQVELSLPVKMVDGEAYMLNLPTSDPSSPGQLWNDSGTLKVSTTSPPSAPSAPSNPSLCKNTTLNVLRFEWDSVASADSYDVYRSTDGSNFSFITNTSITRYDDSVPFNDQSQLYYYKVQARNDGGNSGFSSTVNDSWNTATAC